MKQKEESTNYLLFSISHWKTKYCILKIFTVKGLVMHYSTYIFICCFVLAGSGSEQIILEPGKVPNSQNWSMPNFNG